MRFSIVTICRNDLSGLQITHRSVISQTLQDFQWIVIDGASGDGTPAWLAENLAPAQWISEPDGGLYDAMNKGLDQATGDFLIFMNGGDAFADERVLERVEMVLTDASRPPDFIYGDAIDVLPTGEELYRQARSHHALWYSMFARHQAMFFRRERIGHLRHPERFRLSGDYAFLSSFLNPQDPIHEVLVEQLNFAICRFDMSGVSNSNRLKGMREDFHIRGDYLGQSGVRRAVLWVAHFAYVLLQERLPGIARSRRYGSRPAPDDESTD